MGTKTIIAVVLGVLLIAGLVTGVYFIFREPTTQVSLGQNARLYYPRYRAICCDEKASNAWVDVKTLSSNNLKTAYTCPLQTTNCKFLAEPYVDCRWYETSVWKMDLYNPQNQLTNSWNKNPFGIAGNDFEGGQPEFSPGYRVNYRAVCINVASLIGVPSFTKIWNIASSPQDNNLNIQNIHTCLKGYNTQGVPEGCIPNTIYCNRAGVNLNEEDNEPESAFESVVDKVTDLMKDEKEDIGYDAETNYLYLKNTPDQIFPGECSLSIGEWDEIPFDYNVNSNGKYKNENVMCELAMGLIKVEEIETEGDTTYFAPTTRYETPDKFCCTHQDCKYLGEEYNCAYGKYTCEKTVARCTTDLDCQPLDGIFQDANCYMDEAGKFFIWGSQCIRGSCTEWEKQEVKCCSSYCEAFGKVCKFDEGCVDVIPPNQPCPPGSCCEEENFYQYIPKECEEDLECCNIKDGIGNCKAECEPEHICGYWIKMPEVLGGATIIPDLWCLLNQLIEGSRRLFAVIAGLLGGLISLAYHNKFINPLFKTNKPKIISSILVFVVLGIAIGFLAYSWFWYIILALIILGIVRAFIPGI